MKKGRVALFLRLGPGAQDQGNSDLTAGFGSR